MTRFIPAVGICSAIIVLSSCTTKTAESAQDAVPDKEKISTSKSDTEGMIWVEGGVYVMGSEGDFAENHEGPTVKVEVSGFYIDTTEVTNAKFRAFTDATGYITIAERDIDWNELSKELAPGTPRPADSLLAAGSLVFTPPTEPVPFDDIRRWWRWQPGANWRHPYGPDSDLTGKENHPVVHIAYEDALAYCDWAGKRLPTEAEWEFAARGNSGDSQFQWGDELTPNGIYLANFFQGEFPYDLKALDGFKYSAPVGSFEPNSYGIYDMIGNVWEWTSDYYQPDIKKQYAAMGLKVCRNPLGPSSSFDPNDPYATEKRVIKGGSFLCSEQYCSNYRPSARMATSFDSGQNHLGFRCVANKN
ncbi:MAG: formylglycine-generating enzyme family protein [Flavobacteriales bacterium]|nr:formylglycine-generating enzyme family protein [Flavobacteriales bacterium]